jgi:putative oxidoreductase
MARVSGFRTAWQPRLLSIVRLVAGLLFMEHGMAKLFGFPHVRAFAHLQFASLIGLAGVIETFGGALVALGLFTRPAALILSGEMAVAYFKVHFPRSFFPLLNGGEDAILYCFIFLYLSLVGGGAWSLDRLRRR